MTFSSNIIAAVGRSKLCQKRFENTSENVYESSPPTRLYI